MILVITLVLFSSSLEVSLSLLSALLATEPATLAVNVRPREALPVEIALLGKSLKLSGL